MRVFMFKPKFADDVAAGKKRQTIRLHARCKPGDTLSLRRWEAKPYRSKQVHIMDAVCTRVDPVGIDRLGIVVAGKDLASDEAAVFAAADGFDTEDEMIDFFETEHGLPFSGDLICWEPKTALLRRCDSCGCMTAIDFYNCPKNKAEMIIPGHTVEEVTEQEAISAFNEYKPCKCVCECKNWATIDHRHGFLTGHHVNCPKSPNALECAYKLIAALSAGIEDWGSEEDGIPDFLWESYRTAKALEGVFVDKEPKGVEP